MTIIEVQELSKIYHTGLKKGNIVALDGLSLSVEQGEIFGLLGPNGAGKTTLIKCLLGITRISSGMALLNGLPPSDPQSRKKIGFLPENHNFPDYLTGEGLLHLTGLMYGMSNYDIAERSKFLLGVVAMDRWAQVRITKYSKGMLQRIGLAQSIVSDPDIIFLDEPTDGVDPLGRIEIRNVLKRLRDEGKTIFLNSHLLSEVEALADRVSILRKGRVVRTARVDELAGRDKQFVISAAIGNQRIEIPKDIGKQISITSKEMIIELLRDEDINYVIDLLRGKKISIKSIVPRTVSLEQSFIELIGTETETETETVA